MKSNLTYSPFYFLHVLGVAPTFLDKQKKSDFCVPLDNEEQQNISVPLDNANQPNINNPLDNSGILVNNEAQHTCTILYKCTSTNFLHLLIFFLYVPLFFFQVLIKISILKMKYQKHKMLKLNKVKENLLLFFLCSDMYLFAVFWMCIYFAIC